VTIKKLFPQKQFCAPSIALSRLYAIPITLTIPTDESPYD